MALFVFYFIFLLFSLSEYFCSHSSSPVFFMALQPKRGNQKAEILSLCGLKFFLLATILFLKQATKIYCYNFLFDLACCRAVSAFRILYNFILWKTIITIQDKALFSTPWSHNWGKKIHNRWSIGKTQSSFKCLTTHLGETFLDFPAWKSVYLHMQIELNICFQIDTWWIGRCIKFALQDHLICKYYVIFDGASDLSFSDPEGRWFLFIIYGFLPSNDL